MVFEHDVIAVSSVILDAKTRDPPKKANNGIYGIDWWNIYVPIPLIEKLTSDIKEVSGHIVNQACVIMDKPQSLPKVSRAPFPHMPWETFSNQSFQARQSYSPENEQSSIERVFTIPQSPPSHLPIPNQHSWTWNYPTILETFKIYLDSECSTLAPRVYAPWAHCGPRASSREDVPTTTTFF